MTKVYSHNTASNAVVRIQVGKREFEFEFTGGNLNLKKKVAATYRTDNPILQYILEHSELYKNGVISLSSKYETVVSKKEDGTIVEEVKAVEKEIVKVEEVTTKAEAVEYLKGIGIKATLLRNEPRIREQMRINGLDFPNWKEGE